MARRSGLNDEDLTVVSDVIEKQIAAELKTEGIDMLAPLFRVREKVIALKGKSNGAPKAARPRANRPRTTAAEVEQ